MSDDQSVHLLGNWLDGSKIAGMIFLSLSLNRIGEPLMLVQLYSDAIAVFLIRQALPYSNVAHVVLFQMKISLSQLL